MKIEMGRWLIWACVVSFVLSCDTEKNIAPPEDSYFLKYYGGEGDQEGVDMLVKADGTFLLFGTTRPPGKTSQLYLVNADARGHVIWEKTYGGLHDEEARDIEFYGKSENIVIVANTKTAIGDRDIMIMTLAPDGAKIDSSGYSITGGLDEIANSVTETNDGFIVAGYTKNTKPKPSGSLGPPDLKDALYVRFLSSPLRLYPNTWVAVNGATSSDETTKIIEVKTNEFYFFGFSNNTPTFTYDNWYFGLGSSGISSGDIKIPYVGNEISRKAIMNPLENGGGYVMIGSSISAAGDSSIYLVKLRKDLLFTSTSGDIESIQVQSSNLNMSGAAISASKSSGYLILSNQRDGTGKSDVSLSRLSGTLVRTWTEPTALVFGGACEDTAGAVTELSDGHIMIIGTLRTGDECESKMTLIKVNKDGKFQK